MEFVQIDKKLNQDFKIPTIRCPYERGVIKRRKATRFFLSSFKACHPNYWKNSFKNIIPFYGLSFFGAKNLNLEFENFLKQNSSLRCEMMIHPADERLMKNEQDPIASIRKKEFCFLNSNEFENLKQKYAFEICSFNQLQD